MARVTDPDRDAAANSVTTVAESLIIKLRTIWRSDSEFSLLLAGPCDHSAPYYHDCAKLQVNHVTRS